LKDSASVSHLVLGWASMSEAYRKKPSEPSSRVPLSLPVHMPETGKAEAHQNAQGHP
jgi:hypothetical protein